MNIRMEKEFNAISLVESFLKQLQNIGMVKEYSLLPSEANHSYCNKFEYVYKEFNTQVNAMLSSHEKAIESAGLKVVTERECDSRKTKQSLQKDEKCASNLKNMVQLQVNESEIKHRIHAFVSRKRQEVDEFNVHEFCSRPYVDDQNPVWEQMDSCARVDAVFIPRTGSKSHVKVSKVENQWGPQTQQPAKRIKTEPDTETISEQKDISFEVIQERLQNMESHLNIKSDNSLRNSIFQRLKLLEDRILYLEGISPDYFHLIGSDHASPKKKNIQDREKVYSNWSKDEIKKRIQMLEESLRSKSVLKKESSTRFCL